MGSGAPPLRRGIVHSFAGDGWRVVSCCQYAVMYGESRWGGSVASAWAIAAQELPATGTKSVRSRRPWRCYYAVSIVRKV